MRREQGEKVRGKTKNGGPDVRVCSTVEGRAREGRGSELEYGGWFRGQILARGEEVEDSTTTEEKRIRVEEIFTMDDGVDDDTSVLNFFSTIEE